MTKEQFIASVEAKPNFIKWAVAPEQKEVLGDIQKWHGIAFVTTPDGTNTFNVWFIVDTATNEATWQSQDTLEPEKNTAATKANALMNYLKSNFAAYFLIQGKIDTDNNWAEAEVLETSGSDLVRKRVLVFKNGANPITHKIITN